MMAGRHKYLLLLEFECYLEAGRHKYLLLLESECYLEAEKSDN